MLATEKPIQVMQAADLMSRDLVLIPDDISLQDAARRLVRNQVSGAPVVDCSGALVGVISSFDFVRQVTHDGGQGGCGPSPCVYAEWQVVDVEQLPNDTVRRCMTPDPITASEDTPVTELARMMVDAHVHRIIVVDGDRMPRGIITSSDILAAVSRLAQGGEFGVG